MRVAVASEGLQVAPRFRNCTGVTVYTVKRGVITECQNIPNLDITTKKLAAFLFEMGVDVLIVNSIDESSVKCLGCLGVDVVEHATGGALQAAQAYLTSTLSGVDNLREVNVWDSDDAADADAFAQSAR